MRRIDAINNRYSSILNLATALTVFALESAYKQTRSHVVLVFPQTLVKAARSPELLSLRLRFLHRLFEDCDGGVYVFSELQMVGG